VHPNAYLEMADTEARHWWFAGRRSILATLIAGFALPPDAKILEIGSGTGGNLDMLSAFGQVNALETDAAARAIAAEKTGNRFDIRAGRCPNDIPFAAETFELVCLFDVLEHIDEDVETLAAVKKLLAADGRILVTVPAYRWLWSGHDEFLHHKRRYGRSELRAKAVAAGLTVEKISYFNTALFPLAALVRLKDRLLRSPLSTGKGIPPAPLNRIFQSVFGAERFVLKSHDLPFGVSLLALLRTGQGFRS
jgi:SAM-dependent methyltransferase